MRKMKLLEASNKSLVQEKLRLTEEVLPSPFFVSAYNIVRERSEDRLTQGDWTDE